MRHWARGASWGLSKVRTAPRVLLSYVPAGREGFGLNLANDQGSNTTRRRQGDARSVGGVQDSSRTRRPPKPDPARAGGGPLGPQRGRHHRHQPTHCGPLAPALPGRRLRGVAARQARSWPQAEGGRVTQGREGRRVLSPSWAPSAGMAAICGGGVLAHHLKLTRPTRAPQPWRTRRSNSGIALRRGWSSQFRARALTRKAQPRGPGLAWDSTGLAVAALQEILENR
jgi:hypothetical protein